MYKTNTPPLLRRKYWTGYIRAARPGRPACAGPRDMVWLGRYAAAVSRAGTASRPITLNHTASRRKGTPTARVAPSLESRVSGPVSMRAESL